MWQAKTLFFGLLFSFSKQTLAAEMHPFMQWRDSFIQVIEADKLTYPATLGENWVTFTDRVDGRLVSFSYCRQCSCQKGPLADMYQDRLPQTYVSCGWRDRNDSRFGGGFQRRYDFQIPGYSKKNSYIIKISQAYSVKTPDMITPGWPHPKTSLRLIDIDAPKSPAHAHSMHHFHDLENDTHRCLELSLTLEIPAGVKKFRNNLRLDFLGVNVQDVRFDDLSIEILEVK